MKTIKILQANTCLNVIATGRITEQIGEKILAEGWESYVATYAPIKESTSKVIVEKNNILRFIHRLFSRLLDAQGLLSIIQTSKMIKRIKEIDPDIVHLHDIHGSWINYPLLFRYIQKYNKPVVWTFHDCWAFTGHCAYFDDANCYRWETGCYNCPLKNHFSIDCSSKNYKLKKKYFANVNNMMIVPVSEWISEITRHSFLAKYPLCTIHNGIDTDAFSPKTNKIRTSLGLSNQFVVLGVAANWGRSKGLNDFIALAHQNSYKIVLIGIPDSLKKELPNSIIAISHTDSQEQLAEYYSMADVFVNPTYHDNFPTVNLEALACGTPIVTYRTGGSPEAIENMPTKELIAENKYGYVVEKGNINALAQAIEFLMNETEEKRKQRSYACRKRAVEMFNKNTCFNQYIEVYKRLLHLCNA